MRSAYEQLTDASELPALLGRLATRTVVLDVEPLIASWDSSQLELDRGIECAVAIVAAVPGVRVLCFATNSGRVPSAAPRDAAIRIEYLVSARKPLRTRPYRSWPRPGVVVGDQVPTDGLLARRLGYTFVQYRPPRQDTPIGPLLLGASGELIRPFLFTSRQAGLRLGPAPPGRAE